jgi:hypothetical protein
MAGLCAALVLATTFAPPPEPAPGGYWSIAEQRQRRGEPRDGGDELTIGSVLFSLGLLRTGAAVLTIWMARTPGQCPVTQPGGCRSLEIYGWFGVGEGGLMTGTGLTYLIIGAVRQQRHRRWQSGQSVALPRPGGAAQRFDVGPWLLGRPEGRPLSLRADPVGGGAQFRIRF